MLIGYKYGDGYMGIDYYFRLIAGQLYGYEDMV